MPNYCSNQLLVKGDPKEVSRFYNENKTEKSPLSFKKSVPIPDHIYQGGSISQEERDKYCDKTWYDWCPIHWGTKWDACDPVCFPETIDKGILNYDFETAWSPPEAWLKKVAEKYQLLEFVLSYREPGMNFKGTTAYQNGELLTAEYDEGCCSEQDSDSDT